MPAKTISAEPVRCPECGREWSAVWPNPADLREWLFIGRARRGIKINTVKCGFCGKRYSREYLLSINV